MMIMDVEDTMDQSQTWAPLSPTRSPCLSGSIRPVFHSYSPTPRTSYNTLNMSMEESISLEETNKIRISLGLKPLVDDKAATNDPDKKAEDNYRKVRETEDKARETK
jgi:hypothetical protein